MSISCTAWPQRAAARRDSINGTESSPPTTTTATSVTPGAVTPRTTTSPSTTSASVAMATSEPSTPRKTLCTPSVMRRISAAELRRKWKS